MFDKLFDRFKTEAPEQSGDAKLEVAFAALLVEAARIDADYSDKERSLIDRALKSRFDLSDGDASALRARAEAAQADANDIQRFTKIAKSMSREEKIELIEELWEIVLSDGERDPYEETLVRQICGLIYLDDQDSGAARSRVAARLA